MAELDYRVDRSNMGELLKGFPLQCKEAIEIGERADFRDGTGKRNLVVSGMGGSAMGGQVVKACLSGEAGLPIYVNRDYNLPGWVGENTLLLISSYSGNTEETLSAYEEGKIRGAAMVCMTSGGRLEELAKEDGFHLVKIPSGLPPRCALGYLSVPIFVLLARRGMVENKGKELSELVGILKQMGDELSRPGNPALELAQRLKGSLPIVYSSERFGVAATRWRTQLNENSKTFVHTNLLPELNHNEIVGWDNPAGLLKEAQVVFLRDREEHSQVRRRFEITGEILRPLASGISQVWSRGEGLLSRLYSLIYLGDYLSYYLALLRGVDPTPIERIDYLKEKLR